MPNFPLGMPVTGCGFTMYGITVSDTCVTLSPMLRACALRPGAGSAVAVHELRRVVVGMAGDAVLVRLAVHHRLGEEVAVSRRRRRGPLERGGVPGVLGDAGALPEAHEEVHDEDELRQPQAPRAPADEDVERLHATAVRIDGRGVEPARKAGHALEEHRHGG